MGNQLASFAEPLHLLKGFRCIWAQCCQKASFTVISIPHSSPSGQYKGRRDLGIQAEDGTQTFSVWVVCRLGAVFRRDVRCASDSAPGSGDRLDSGPS